MAVSLVAQVQLVVVDRKVQAQHTRGEWRVLMPGSALAAVGCERRCIDTERNAGLAVVAMRAVGEHTAATKTVGDEF
jgi:hypothetical protein